MWPTVWTLVALAAVPSPELPSARNALSFSEWVVDQGGDVGGVVEYERVLGGPLTAFAQGGVGALGSWSVATGLRGYPQGSPLKHFFVDAHVLAEHHDPFCFRLNLFGSGGVSSCDASADFRGGGVLLGWLLPIAASGLLTAGVGADVGTRSGAAHTSVAGLDGMEIPISGGVVARPTVRLFFGRRF